MREGQDVREEGESIDCIERFVLSIALSLALATIAVFLINAVVTFPITATSFALILGLLLIMGLVILRFAHPEVLVEWRRFLKKLFARLMDSIR